MRGQHNLSAFSHLNSWIEGELYLRTTGANHVPLSKKPNRLKGQGLDSRPEDSCVILSSPGNSEPPIPGILGCLVVAGIIIVLDRADYWQTGLIFPKGQYQQLRAQGINAIRRTILKIRFPRA
jgi:hypothetical protein